MEIDRDGLYEHGVLRRGMNWQVPRLPGLGEVRWDRFCAALYAVGYDRWISIEHEDRALRGRRGARQARVPDRARRAAHLRALSSRSRGAAARAPTRPAATSRSGARRAPRTAPRRRTAAARRAASRPASARPRRPARRARARDRRDAASRARAPRPTPALSRPRAPRAGGRAAGARARTRARASACWISARRARSKGTISVGKGRSAHTPHSQSGGTGPGCASSARTRGAADELVRVVAVVRRGRAHERRRELGQQLARAARRAHPRRAARSSPAESASGGSHGSSSKPARRQASSQLGPPALVLLRPAEAAGQVDDAPAGVAQRHQRRRHARDLVVRVRGEVQRDASLIRPSLRARG